MVYNLTYRRPASQSSATSSTDSLAGEQKQNSINESIKTTSSCSMLNGIPEQLTFEKIVYGGTCPPLTLRDFMNYLKYIEHAAENLQFFMWHRAYVQKFEALPAQEKSLSPEWTLSKIESEALATQNVSRKMKISADTAAAMRGTGLDSTQTVAESEKANPFFTPPRTPSNEVKRQDASSMFSATESKSMGWESNEKSTSVSKRVEGAYDEAGLKWQPFTIQPFRDEVSRIISIYIADGGARQLNLSSKERAALLHALENTTHPSAFRHVLTTVEYSLRFQAHPNFVRWSICNGNAARVFFARGLGISLILAGIVVGILLVLSSAGRAWRVFTFPLFMIGISTLIAAWKGMCVVLHGLHHRHLRPWELFRDADDETVELKNDSFESLASTTTANSWEDEPWVPQYQKRNFIRKIFDRQLWIEEPALRQIQDTIFVQSLLGALLGSGILMAIFLAVPKGNFY